MGQIKFMGALLSIGVFAVVLTLFAINFAVDNNAEFSLVDQPGYNQTLNEIKLNLSTYRTETVNATDSFYKSEILEGETVRTGGQFKLGPITALDTVESTTRQGWRAIFGSDSAFGFIITTFFVFLALVLSLYIWKTWAGRNPD